MTIPDPPTPTPDPTPSPRPRRHWLRLSLRASMVLVLLVGGGMGWVVQRIRTQREAIAAVRAADGVVFFDFEQEEDPDARWLVNGQQPYRTEPAAPRWLRRILGDELFQEVRRVEVPGSAGDDLLFHLGRFAGLELLDLADVTGSGAGWRHLRGLGRLRYLRGGGAGLTDAALAEVAGLGAIEALEIRRASATDAGFAGLARLAAVTDLRVADAPGLTDAGAARLLAGMPALRELAIAGPGPPALGATLGALARHHPDLRALTLDGSRVADADLAALAGLPRLTNLSLDDTAVTDAGLGVLGSLPDLGSFSAAGTALTDAGLAGLRGRSRLGYLFLERTAVTDAGLAHLDGCPLRLLILNATRVADAGVATVGRMSTLTNLDLQDLPGLTDAGLASLRGLAGLRSIDVSGTAVTDAGLAALRRDLPALGRAAKNGGQRSYYSGRH